MTNNIDKLLHLVVQTYDCDDVVKDRIFECINENLKKDWIGKITVLDEGAGRQFPNSKKISVIDIKSRATYSDMLALMIKDGDKKFSHFAISNSDIFLTDDIRQVLERINQPSTVVCLSRYEIDGRICKDPKGCQDLWLFRNHDPLIRMIQSSYCELGVAGCDHYFATVLFNYGYDMWNPSLNCRIIHNDPNPRIQFTDKDKYSCVYTYIPQCSIEDIEISETKYEHFNVKSPFQTQ